MKNIIESINKKNIVKAINILICFIFLILILFGLYCIYGFYFQRPLENYFKIKELTSGPKIKTVKVNKNISVTCEKLGDIEYNLNDAKTILLDNGDAIFITLDYEIVLYSSKFKTFTSLYKAYIAWVHGPFVLQNKLVLPDDKYLIDLKTYKVSKFPTNGTDQNEKKLSKLDEEIKNKIILPNSKLNKNFKTYKSTKFPYDEISQYETQQNKVYKELKDLEAKLSKENNKKNTHSSNFNEVLSDSNKLLYALYDDKVYLGVVLADLKIGKLYKYGKFNMTRTSAPLEFNYNRLNKVVSIAERGFLPLFLKNGKVLIIGGCQDKSNPQQTTSINSIELYDPITGSVSLVGKMKYPRTEPSAIELYDGKIFITGGINYNNDETKMLNNAEILNLKNNELSMVKNNYGEIVGKKRRNLFKSGAPILYFQSNIYKLILLNNNIVLLTGFFTEIYDPETNMFYPLLDLVVPRANPTVTVLKNGQVIITNGFLNPNIPHLEDTPLKFGELLKIKTNSKN